MHASLRGHVPQVCDNSILQVKFLDALGLLREHELEVIYTNSLDIVSVNGMIERLHDLLHTCRPVKIQEMERKLRELLQCILSLIRHCVV